MSPWNVIDGVSLHAIPLAREWEKMGHKIIVFAPKEKHVAIQKDESNVFRCYNNQRKFPYFPKWLFERPYLDEKPFLESNYEILMVENLGMMPAHLMQNIWPKIKEKAKTALIIHEGEAFLPPDFFPLAKKFDKVVCFDRRFLKVLENKISLKKIAIIPYPSFPTRLADKNEMRSELNLSKNKKIIFAFGLKMDQHFPTLDTLEKINKKIPLIFLLVTAEKGFLQTALGKKVQEKYPFIKIREEILSFGKLDKYLFAADALLLFKRNDKIAIPTTVNVCLGSGCPIFINEGGYSQTSGDEVFIYKNFDDLEKKMTAVFRGEKPNRKALDSFLNKTNATKVANTYIKLFKSLIS
jgi:hypothetical protein